MKLKAARESRYPRVTQDIAAKLAGNLKRSTYASYEANLSEPPETVVKMLAMFWEIPLSWFYDGKDTVPPKSGASTVRETGPPLYPVSHDTIQIPMWPAVPAGDWDAPGDTIDFYDVDVRLFKRERIACKIVGDSMHPYLQQGDVGVFQLDPHPQIGSIVLARNKDNEATVKQLAFTESGHALVSLNGGDEVHASKWEALGYLVARVRDLGPGRFSQVVNQGGLRPDELT